MSSGRRTNNTIRHRCQNIMDQLDDALFLFFFQRGEIEEAFFINACEELPAHYERFQFHMDTRLGPFVELLGQIIGICRTILEIPSEEAMIRLDEALMVWHEGFGLRPGSRWTESAGFWMRFNLA